MSDVPSLTVRTQIVYLDNNATTPCFPEVVEAMAPYWSANYGNPASAHFAGRLANRAVSLARKTIAERLGVSPYQIFFTSGATEGNNWLFKAFAEASPERRKIVVGSIEHKSVLNAALALERLGFEVALLPVTPAGAIDLEAARCIIDGQTGLVAVQLANNETGVIQPVRELVAAAHENGAFFHCDAVQGLGKMAVDLCALGVDSATFSGHKIHGPKGIGLLYLKVGAERFPFAFPVQGGGQEQGVRPGTLNVPGIVGLAKAFELLPDAAAWERIRLLREHLEAALLVAVPGCVIHGAAAQRLPNTTNVAIPNVPSDILIANLPLFCISSGSACNSSVVEASYVLQQMGIEIEQIRKSIRVSMSSLTTIYEIDSFVNELHLQIKNIGGYDGE